MFPFKMVKHLIAMLVITRGYQDLLGSAGTLTLAALVRKTMINPSYDSCDKLCFKDKCMLIGLAQYLGMF